MTFRKEAGHNPEFVRAWISHALLCEDTLDVLDYMRTQGIGNRSVEFYEQYCQGLIQERRYADAARLMGEAQGMMEGQEQRHRWQQVEQQHRASIMHQLRLQEAAMGKHRMVGHNDLRRAYERLTALEALVGEDSPEYMEALKQCTLGPQLEQHHSDPLFVQAWLKYATLVGNPGDVLEYMAATGIGSGSSYFYRAKARYHVGCGDLDRAEDTYQQAFSICAEPMRPLLEAHRRFKVRIGGLQEPQQQAVKSEKEEGDTVGLEDGMPNVSLTTTFEVSFYVPSLSQGNPNASIGAPTESIETPTESIGTPTESIGTPSASTDEGVIIAFSEEIFKQLDALEPELLEKLTMGRIRMCGTTPKHPTKGTKLPMGGDLVFRVIKKLGAGAYGRVFLADEVASGKASAVKVQSPPRLWEQYVACQIMHRIPRSERFFGCCRQTFYNAHSSYGLMEVLRGGTLHEMIQKYIQHTAGGAPESLVMVLTLCLLDAVDWLHSANLLHGDIKPDNILVVMGQEEAPLLRFGESSLHIGVKLVDFGKSVDLTQFPKGTRFFGRSGSRRLWSPEMCCGHPWLYEADFYGVCNTVHCMLFGRYLRCTAAGHATLQFKRYWNVGVWEDLFTSLMKGGTVEASAGVRSTLQKVISQTPKLMGQIDQCISFIQTRS
ncbi:MAG: protein kinase [archaeon]|nr:protein kinase [archaeon]